MEHHDHFEEHHAHDLFDLDDPMSDSSYDDMDEETGIYHDENPYEHPAQHVRHHFSEDQYHHARDRYFSEDSYHAAGQMKYGYDVVSTEDLVAHALGIKPSAETKPAP